MRLLFDAWGGGGGMGERGPFSSCFSSCNIDKLSNEPQSVARLVVKCHFSADRLYWDQSFVALCNITIIKGASSWRVSVIML